jgi:hypothetical protein
MSSTVYAKEASSMAKKAAITPLQDSDSVDLNSRELIRQVILQRESSVRKGKDDAIRINYHGIELVETERTEQISLIGSFVRWLMQHIYPSKFDAGKA